LPHALCFLAISIALPFRTHTIYIYSLPMHSPALSFLCSFLSSFAPLLLWRIEQNLQK
jgi:hypothetical protein